MGFQMNNILIYNRFSRFFKSVSKKSFGSFNNQHVMESEDFSQFSREELLRKINYLQQECKVLKARGGDVPRSKFEELNQKFNKIESKSNRKKGQKRQFDPSKCTQRKIALKVVYFGWDLMGLQDNPGLDDTIEKIMFEALSRTKLLVVPVKDAEYTKCGRTDKGVSAFSQVLSLNLRCFKQTDSTSSDTTGISDSGKVDSDCELDYCSILNHVLPEEIRVTGWAAVENEQFSARFHCVGRFYKYFFPLGSLNINKMKNACKLLIGTHDFRNFCKMNVEETTVFIREIRDFTIERNRSHQDNFTSVDPHEMYVATIHGTGFLYHQVRYMMGILFLVGLGFEEPSLVSELLDVEKTPKKPQYGYMADFPLTLYDCSFEDLKWNLSDAASKRLHAHFRKFYSTLAIKSVLAKTMLDKFVHDSNMNKNSTDIQMLDSNDETPFNMSSIKEYDVNGFLLSEKCSSKQYKKVMQRHTGLSLDEKISNMENRKKRKLDRESMLMKDY